MSRRCHHGSPRHARPMRPIPGPTAGRRLNGHALASAPGFESPTDAGPLDELAIDELSIDELAIDEPAQELEAPGAEPADDPAGPTTRGDVGARAVDRAEPEPEAATAEAATAEAATAEAATGLPSASAEAAVPPAPRAPIVAPRQPLPRPMPSQGLAARMPMPPPRPAPTAVEGDDGHEAGAVERGATAPQLRRFIKSRAYVPMHELRRRFAINGGEDDVTPVELERSRIYVGLPEREGRLLGELLRAGDIGYELSMDPISPIVVGVYPMRPVSRG